VKTIVEGRSADGVGSVIALSWLSSCGAVAAAGEVSRGFSIYPWGYIPDQAGAPVRTARPERIHAEVPPVTDTASRPAVTSAWAARRLRLPLAQMT
jgi:hypothetical protein